MTNKEKYIQAFVTAFGAHRSELGGDYTAETVEKWDSMTHMSLVSELEDAFDIMLDAEDIVELKTFDSGIEILKKYQVEI